MNTRKPVVLLAPLDWGLGHTVRCIPIIEKLLLLGCEVLVACNSKQRMLLSDEFENLQFTELTGYRVKYGKGRLQTIFRLILQIPGILIVINREQTWLKQFLANHKVDAIISDNRYGLSSRQVPSVLITHQLRVKSGLGVLVDGFIQKMLYRYINRFSTCWIPDWEDKAVSAAGDLSHPNRLPAIGAEYIGCLSRFEKCSSEQVVTNLLIVLSGPEPQRTIFENILRAQLSSFTGSVVLVRGVQTEPPMPSFSNLKILNYTSTKELNNLICNSTTVISRPGYTSIMDLLKTGKRSILVPTPGQAEQEYLGRYMQERGIAVTVEQDNFDLHSALARLEKLPGIIPSPSMAQYESAVEELTKSLKTGDQSLSADFGKSKK